MVQHFPPKLVVKRGKLPQSKYAKPILLRKWMFFFYDSSGESCALDVVFFFFSVCIRFTTPETVSCLSICLSVSISQACTNFICHHWLLFDLCCGLFLSWLLLNNRANILITIFFSHFVTLSSTMTIRFSWLMAKLNHQTYFYHSVECTCMWLNGCYRYYINFQLIINQCIQVVLDGYSAPLTAGNVAKLVR